MEILIDTTIFGKTKYYVYQDDKKVIKLALDYVGSVPDSNLLLIEYKGKRNVVDNSIMGQSKSQVISGMRYDEYMDFGSFVSLQGEDKRRLKFIDKKTKREITVENGFVYSSDSDRFIVYCDWSNEYRAVLNTSKGMDTYTLPDMKTRVCVQKLFHFCGNYLNSAHLIADLENPRHVYKIMRDFLKRLLQEDIINFDKETKKYLVPNYDLNNVALKSVKYSTPEEAKVQANKVLKHFDDVVLAAIEKVEQKQKDKQASILKQEQQGQQREQDIQTALNAFNAE